MKTVIIKLTKMRGISMQGYIILIIAIIGEVFGSSMLKASNGFKRVLPIFGVIIGYGVAFYALSLALKTIPLGMAYAIWSGLGTVLTALIGIIIYKEGISSKKLFGIGLIIGGVVILNLGGTH
jgi:multidrug resistance protein EbrA